ncbi:MAG: hypothetical protein KGY99_02145 [Phycisphaerae bacterium]|nr:hypothetical protein [Phycisphaerae bacterium]
MKTGRYCSIALAALAGFGLVYLDSAAQQDVAGGAQPQQHAQADAGQQDNATGAKPAERHARELLKHVPADAVALVMAGNMREALEGVDAFVQAVRPTTLDEPPEPWVPLLSRIQEAAGPGLNPDQAVGIMLLPAEKYGMAPAGPMRFILPIPPPVSFAAVVPGKGIGATLGEGWIAHEDVEGLYVQGDDAFAWQSDKHVIVAPSLKTAKALRAEAPNVLSNLSARDLAMLEAEAFAAWGRLDFVGAFFDKILMSTIQMQRGVVADAPPMATTGPARTTTRPATGPAGGSRPARADGLDADGADDRHGDVTHPPKPPKLSPLLDLYWGGDATICAGVGIDAEGVRVDGVLDCGKGSLLDKGLAATKQDGAAKLIRRLPAARHAVIAGGVNLYRAAPKELRALLAAQLDVVPVEMPAGLRRRHTDAMAAVYTQLRSTRLWVGARTAMEGKLGAAVVMECESAEAMRDALAALCDTTSELMRLAPDADEAPQFHYVRGEGEAADVIRMKFAELDDMSAEERRILRAILGTKPLEFPVVPVDANTLVLAVGGETGFAEQVAAAARADIRVARPKALQDAVSDLPEHRVLVAAADVGGYWDLIKSVIDSVDEDADMPPLKLTTRVPILAAAWADEGDLGLRLHAPREPIAQIVQAFADAWAYERRKWERRRMEREVPQPVPPGDF